MNGVDMACAAEVSPAAVLQGSPTDFPKTKEQYVNWGDFDDDGGRSKRFGGEPLEPYTQPLHKD